MFSDSNVGINHIKRVIFDADNVADKTRPPPGSRFLASLLDKLPDEQLEYFRYVFVSYTNVKLDN
jgi:hypothetical protein